MMPLNWKLGQLPGLEGLPATELTEDCCTGITDPACQGEIGL